MKRIIACLDVLDGRTVKGKNFVGMEEMGDPVDMGKRYADEGADELVYLDISATVEGRKTFTGLVERIAKVINIPFTVGGGIGSLDDAARLRDAGATSVSINSAAVADPNLINRLAERYGSDFVISAIDGKLADDGKWYVATHGGTRISDRELFDWALEVEERGASQILFTSMDHDGTKKGYPVETFAQLAESVRIPLIASGGAGTLEHISDVLTKGRADAALVAGILHRGEVNIPQIKEHLKRCRI